MLDIVSPLLLEQLKCGTKEERRKYFQQIKEQERKGDVLSNLIFEELSSSFITPFDREDIHLLADRLDDIVDLINSSSKRIAIYSPKNNNPHAIELAEVVKSGAECISKAVDELSNVRKNATILKQHCQELHDLENKADDIYETAIIQLFDEEKDNNELIKMKEILAELEKATDAVERLGKAMKTIIVKYA